MAIVNGDFEFLELRYSEEELRTGIHCLFCIREVLGALLHVNHSATLKSGKVNPIYEARAVRLSKYSHFFFQGLLVIN